MNTYHKILSNIVTNYDYNFDTRNFQIASFKDKPINNLINES